MKISYTALMAAIVTAAAASAPQIDLSKLPPPSTRQDVTYEKDIRPIFEGTCVRCHGPERPKAGLRLDSLEGVLKGSKEEKVVKPGNSEKSQLVIAVSQLDPETAMPPKPRPGRPRGGAPGARPWGDATNAPAGGPPPNPKRPKGPPPKPLTAEQVGLMRAWIDQGAK
jgi:mono/diheme cytochrome c family protein